MSYKRKREPGEDSLKMDLRDAHRRYRKMMKGKQRDKDRRKRGIMNTYRRVMPDVEAFEEIPNE